MKSNFFLLIFLSIFVFIACSQKQSAQKEILLNSGWKFINQDNLTFAQADYDDSAWKEIAVNQTWEKQGFEKYDGFGWYRNKVIIPSELKENSILKDSLIFYLGKIDDFDQVFLNGHLIGQNLRTMPTDAEPSDNFKDLNYSYWNKERRYALSVNDPRIKWDEENVLAVRVFDWGGAGGIFSGELKITMPALSDYVELKNQPGWFKITPEGFHKELQLFNKAGKYTIGGTLEIQARSNIDHHVLMEKSFDFLLKPKNKVNFSFTLPRPKESTIIDYQLNFKQSKVPLKISEGVPYILTPPVKPQPQINGTLIYGQRTGKPLLYRIATTGKRPMQFRAKGMPSGLHLNAETGIISGKVETPGNYQVKITATNSLGSVTKEIKFVIGDQIALTPPMGWNSWNVWGLSVTQERVYAAARAFMEKGLTDHGWTFINIDDGWEIYRQSSEPKRKANGEIRTNEKFPNMKKLGDDIHALGLKFGIYSSPGPLTCGGYTASYQHEEQDAQTFARWGVDYLKYDLCSYRKFMKNMNDPKELKVPYLKMYQALQKVDRDIVYSLCEYGLGQVWQWGAEVGGNLWRTTGDIWDEWSRVFEIGFNQEKAAPYAGPGHWNDPDMLVIGWLGWGENLHYTRLTPDEQYTHVSLWSLLSAPLLLGCDLEKLDAFTLNLITNDEVLAIDQDPLGKQAIPVIKTEKIHVYKKELADGNFAIGIFNIGEKTQTYNLSLKEIGINQKAKLRDLWRQKDLGEFKERFTTTIPAHGVTLLKIFK